jgi:hypothetical protein
MNPMTRTLFAAALAVALLGSVSAYAAGTAAGGSSTTPAATDAPAATPPASLHCKAPKVATHVKGKSGKMTWKCVKPAATPQ